MVSAVSTQMKRYHPGKSPKPGKTDRHLAALASDPRIVLRRRELRLRWLRLVQKRKTALSPAAAEMLDLEIRALVLNLTLR